MPAILKVILAIILPPLAIALEFGVSSREFLINLLLTLLGYIPGLIHALIIL